MLGKQAQWWQTAGGRPPVPQPHRLHYSYMLHHSYGQRKLPVTATTPVVSADLSSFYNVVKEDVKTKIKPSSVHSLTCCRATYASGVCSCRPAAVTSNASCGVCILGLRWGGKTQYYPSTAGSCSGMISSHLLVLLSVTRMNTHELVAMLGDSS